MPPHEVAPLRITYSDIVPAERHALLQWWTDYSDEDHPHLEIPGVFRSRRRIVAREDEKIELENDDWLLGRRFTTRETVRTQGDARIDIDGVSPAGEYNVSFHLEDVPGGATRITGIFEMMPKRTLARIAPVIAPMARAALAWDLRRHLDAFARDYAAREPESGAAKGHPTIWGERQFGR